jgi:heat shock protein HslJ
MATVRLMNALARLLIAAACSTSALACNAGSSRGEAFAARLEGRAFVLLSVQGHELVEGTDIRVSFRDGEVAAHAGCNHISGRFTIDGDQLRIGSLSTTLIGCDAARHEQDAWLQGLLTSSPTITFDDPELTLETDEATLRLIDREVGSPDRPLIGTHWIGNGIGDQNTISGGQHSDLVTVDFAQDGAVEVFTACQNGVGTFTATATTIELADMGYDDSICDDPALASLAAQVRAVLDSGARVSFEIEESNLTLERDGTLLLFRADE